MRKKLIVSDILLILLISFLILVQSISHLSINLFIDPSYFYPTGPPKPCESLLGNYLSISSILFYN